MTWRWLALVDGRPGDACAAVRAYEPGGEPAGVLAAWATRAKPVRHALRVDARLIDPAGEPAALSLVVAERGSRTIFDDPAVQQARRAVLAGPPLDAVSTLLADASHFAGALTVARGRDVARLRDDPFARLAPARVLVVDGGLLGRVPWPAGPVIERYGSEQPWPWGEFPAPG